MGNPVTKRESDILDEYSEIMETLNEEEDSDYLKDIFGFTELDEDE